MAYFDGYTANLFREDAEHRRVIVPWGKRGPVFFVPTQNDADRITRVIRRLFQLMFVAIVVPMVAFGWRWMVVGGLVWVAAFYAGLFLLTKKLPRAPARAADLPPVSRAAAQRRMALAIGRPWLIGLLIGSLLFVVTGIWLIAVRGPAMALYFVVAYFSLCSAIFAYQLRQHAKGKIATRAV
jgi:hypothetical protein